MPSEIRSDNAPDTVQAVPRRAAWRLAGVRAYLFAAAFVGIALLLRFVFDPLWGERIPFGTFFLALLVVARFTETGPTILAMAAGFLLGDWFFVQPRHSMLIASGADQVNAVLYFALSFVVMGFARQARRAEEEQARLVRQLQDALARVKTLSGMLPICSHCKKIRDDKGDWNQIEFYIRARSDASFSHGVCPECARKHYAQVYPGEPAGKMP